MRPEHTLILHLMRRRIRPLGLGAAASAVHQACEATVPLAIGLVISQAVDGGSAQALALALIGTLALFTLLSGAAGVAYWTLNATTQREAHDLRIRLVGRILATDEGRTAGENMSILVSDCNAVATVLKASAFAVSGAVGLLVTAGVLIHIDPMLGLGLLVVVPLFMVGISRIGPVLESRVSAQQQSAGEASALAAEIVRALRPLRGFGGTSEAARRYRRASRHSLQTTLAATTASAVVTGAGLLAMAALLIGTAAVAGQMAFSGRITVGEFVTVVAMASFVIDPLQRIAVALEQLAVSRASAARLLASRPRTSADLPAGHSLEVYPGEMVGVVAPDPVNLVFRPFGCDEMLIEPRVAQLLGGTMAAALDTDREPGSVSGEQAMAAVNLGDVPDNLLDAGANLSGGQRQRVALARALVADPPLLVLQDPLTAVDAVTENAIAGVLPDLRKNRSTVLVSTSPLLLARCDRVVFLGPATITGTHTMLLADPAYAAAVNR